MKARCNSEIIQYFTCQYTDFLITSCLHFVSGAPSKASEKENPDYVPSIFDFPASHSKQRWDSAQRLKRYERSKSRRPLACVGTEIDEERAGIIEIINESEDESSSDETQTGHPSGPTCTDADIHTGPTITKGKVRLKCKG